MITSNPATLARRILRPLYYSLWLSSIWSLGVYFLLSVFSPEYLILSKTALSDFVSRILNRIGIWEGAVTFSIAVCSPTLWISCFVVAIQGKFPNTESDEILLIPGYSDVVRIERRRVVFRYLLLVSPLFIFVRYLHVCHHLSFSLSGLVNILSAMGGAPMGVAWLVVFVVLDWLSFFLSLVCLSELGMSVNNGRIVCILGMGLAELLSVVVFRSVGVDRILDIVSVPYCVAVVSFRIFEMSLLWLLLFVYLFHSQRAKIE